ncbi:MBOAT family O-acyltransferase [Romboutsia sp. 1001713B170131_170501_G6]|uniref:MBOAT family O-acyltransferase n=1 Tax=Romboutsia sp. 1001713B170131_170501_G6 TaxID=2787108 RepID=UPI0018A96619|nr:MBOAT family protein [Romboutsia sp. 1001713B170131_170501_G6]
MVFSSLFFLFLFLPIVLLGYYITKDKYKNYILLIASLFFYAWGEPKYVFLMIFSIICNYYFGIKVNDSSKKKIWLIISIIFNIGLLITFKYADFLFNIKGIKLPLGISFFTFQTMSYVIDVYRHDGKVQKNILGLALYISLFPQLVAGPIVRYQTVDNQINKRIHSTDKFAQVVNRFVIGLSKKVIISNQLGIVSDFVFSKGINSLSIGEAWLGIICYTFQIYFDFGGYSDMAIGLGKMFGFNFLENFNYPYISQSVSEFWRRWHIFLGSFFRDYVYIPLGGSRVSKFKLYRNLFIVWFLTGIWHGANYTFIIWGLYFGIFIALEKAFLEKLLFKLPRLFRHMYLMFIVIIGWVFFRANNLSHGFEFIKVMFGISENNIINSDFITYLNDYYYIILMAIVFSMPIVNSIKKIIIKSNKNLLQNKLAYILQSFFLSISMIVVIVILSSSTYNPFLYFRF